MYLANKVYLYLCRPVRGSHKGTEMERNMPDTWHLWVDYEQSLQMMLMAGHYDLKFGDFPPRLFPLEGKGRVEFEARYFSFEGRMSTQSVVEWIAHGNGIGFWSPARVEHLFSHGAAFPNEQRKFSIVGLGSIVNTNSKNYAPVLHGSSFERVVALGWCDNDWPADIRFLAVRRI
ncbi:MAG: hypothetical protein UY93_C0004G0023 [Parcubacteria group bacterium GW2011_GWA1_56_13]|nr:MAG: hypothetical protein UY93_C0004G0023 [Parcubacteria group bacterium GW2011_GWA1_56_13]